MQKSAVLFGGNGFIGSYLAPLLLEQGVVDHVYLADLVKDETFWPKQMKALAEQGKVTSIICDVRKTIDQNLFSGQVNLIVNLAAIHREPGHQANEYFETNLPGAENVCEFAKQVVCPHIIFTSSIAVYGASDEKDKQRTEATLPTPNTPYGISKLVAEKIHLAWLKESAERSLMIVRPGVIFGAGEKGNVTRMVRAILKGYFVYTGNQDTRKAGGYVKELCRAILWMHKKQLEQNKSFVLFNFSMNPTPTVKQFATAIKTVSGKNTSIPSVPFRPLLWLASLWSVAHKLIGKETGINSMRVHKLKRSNYILPQVLTDSGYDYQYNLESAMTDWNTERPEDWK